MFVTLIPEDENAFAWVCLGMITSALGTRRAPLCAPVSWMENRGTWRRLDVSRPVSESTALDIELW